MGLSFFVEIVLPASNKIATLLMFLFLKQLVYRFIINEGSLNPKQD
jgi:hypothetical protein